jgi:hypothetical protein
MFALLSRAFSNGSVMPHRRLEEIASRPEEDALISDMVGIGMNFAANPNDAAEIEETLVFASELGMAEGDLRTLAVLTTWFALHHTYVNADRLIRLAAQHPSARVRAYWSAVGRWQAKDRRFARLEALCADARVDLMPVGTDFQIQRRGEDARFQGSALRVPNGVLRDRAADVMSPEVVARRHRGYRNRVQMGPTWRADVWTLLEHHPELTAAEAARRVRCSFATAWLVVRDFGLLRKHEMTTGDTRVA